LATNRNLPFESVARDEGPEPAVVREDASVKAPAAESIVKSEMSPPLSFVTYRNFLEGRMQTAKGDEPAEKGEPEIDESLPELSTVYPATRSALASVT
jgi:hypothetical protein